MGAISQGSLAKSAACGGIEMANRVDLLRGTLSSVANALESTLERIEL